MAMKDGYPFIFQMNDRSVHDELLEYTLQYRFKSTKSNRTYIVRVERYANHSNKHYINDIPSFTHRITEEVKIAMSRH